MFPFALGQTMNYVERERETERETERDRETERETERQRVVKTVIMVYLYHLSQDGVMRYY